MLRIVDPVEITVITNRMLLLPLVRMESALFNANLDSSRVTMELVEQLVLFPAATPINSMTALEIKSTRQPTFPTTIGKLLMLLLPITWPPTKTTPT